MLKSELTVYMLIETLGSDNGDAIENVAENLTLCHLKLLRPYTKSPSYLKVGNLG